eukprot:1289996-Pleurochrysis_carterae.AAC.1
MIIPSALPTHTATPSSLPPPPHFNTLDMFVVLSMLRLVWRPPLLARRCARPRVGGWRPYSARRGAEPLCALAADAQRLV